MERLPVILGIRCYPAGGSDLFIQQVVEELSPHITATVVAYSKNPWHGSALPPDNTLQKIGTVDPRAIVYTDNWSNEIEQGNALLDFVYKEFPGSYLLLQDTDEVMDIATLKAGLEFIKRENAGVCRFYQRVYWKTPLHILQPEFQIQTVGLIKMNCPRELGGLRHIMNAREMTLPWEQGYVHHFAYCRDNKTVKEKLGMFSHANEIIPEWYERVWLEWDKNHDLKNLHPIRPNEWTHTIMQHPRALPKSVQTAMGMK